MTLKEELLKDLKRTIERQKDQISVMWFIIGLLSLTVAALLLC